MNNSIAIQEQATDRRTFIGSSDIAAIIGISPWRTAWDVFEEKTADAPEEHDSPILRRGRRAEPYLLETLKSEFDVWVIRANVRSVHPKYPFLQAESDFTYVIDGTHVTEELKLLTSFDDYGGRVNIGHGELKSVGFNRGEWGEAGSQDVPPYYLAQAMFAMHVNQLPEATIWGCFGFDDIRPYRFEYDAETGMALEAAAVAFWTNHVIPRVPPPTKTVEDCRKALAKYQGFTWEASESALGSAARIQAIKRTIKLAQTALMEEEKTILDEMLSAAETYGVTEAETGKFTILGPDGKRFATYNKQERAGYEVKPTSFYVLRFAGNGKKES